MIKDTIDVNRRHVLKMCFALLLCITVSKASFAQESTGPPEYQLKAVFLYNFTHFIDWPATAFEAYNDPFVIGIAGNDPFGSYLEDAVANEFVGRHPIVIKRFADAKDIAHCQVLYINSKDSETAKNMISVVNNNNVLTVSDLSNFASLGGVIGFFMEKNKIRMQINTEAAKNAQLVISSKLLRVAEVL